jgi:2-polyprenyl-6-methoxyphenol hydroxylase-like FAD-dependent oxidoreductase
MRLPGEPIEELNRADTAWKLLARWNLDADNSTLLRHAVYAFCGQWATSWHHGRLILAGDAAHLMPPFLAQGFNSGVRDVAALAWRADLVLSNRAPLDIFASYTSERLPHVRQIIEEAVQIGRMLCITDPGEAAERDQLMLAARDHPEIVPPPNLAARPRARRARRSGRRCARYPGHRLARRAHRAVRRRLRRWAVRHA